ncbi:hypothetical protein PFISCL1PPCAC_3066 [Pristionchus fissidentatus]|uniref:Rho-GAP domain-containing protein n=1 Tax=Pristionchus fissidentatus TaxID=1538716 RepID=A0AAV5V1E1_9BILA|nr:hypothetical protein PFISCL1PPCAC_3066 [Pristionchus fissidentatus]
MTSRLSTAANIGGRNSRSGKAATMPQTQPHPLLLEKLPSQNLELSQVIHRDSVTIEQGYTKVMLRGVPRFLIDAFARIQEEGKRVEGLFRKEGNQARMKNKQAVYYCTESVVASPQCTWQVHDVCSLVKRFLRDLKNPLICSEEIKAKLFAIAAKHPDGVVEPHTLTILFEPTFSNKGIVHPMPAEHIGTLGFIMRQLNELSKDASVHHMNVENLATVFAPTIFRDDYGLLEPPKTPKVTASAKLSNPHMQAKSANKVHIDALIVLIKNAQWIGVPSNFYLASRKESSSSTASSMCSSSSAAAPPGGEGGGEGALVLPPHTSVSSSKSSTLSHRSEEQHPNWARSNSLRPQQQYNAAGIAALPSTFAKGGSVSGRRVEKRHSVKTMSMGVRGRQEDKTTKDRRRSNSSVRDVVPAFFNRITNAVRRKSAERKSPGRLTSPPSRHANGGSSGSRGRSPAKKMLLEVDDHISMSALAAPVEHFEQREAMMRSAVATSRPSLQSSSFLQSVPSKSPRADRLQQKQHSLQHTPTATVQQVQQMQQPKSSQRPTRPPPPLPSASTTSIAAAAAAASGCSRSNSGAKERKKVASPSESRQHRRVSGGVVSEPLPRRSSGRDDPHSFIGEEFINPSHKFRVDRPRRHTAPIKGGLALRRNQPNTVHSGLKGPGMKRAMTIAAADDKENSRVIRVYSRRKGWEEEEDMDEDEENNDTLTDANATITNGIAVVYSSETILEMSHLETRARRERANWRKRKSGEGREGRGGGEVFEQEVEGSPERGDDAAAATVFSMSSKSPAPPPLPLCSPPGDEKKTVSGRRSGKLAVGGEKKEMDDVDMMPPPLSAPPIPCPRTSLEKEGGVKHSPHFAIPTLPVGRTSSVSGSFATPATSRKAIASTPRSSASSTVAVAAHSPLGRRGSSASALDSPKFKPPSSLATRRQLSVGEKEFAFSDRNKAAILDAADAKELNVHSKVGTRPSVALLRNNNRGMVAARVNQYASIQSTTDGNASMRSSLGSSHQSLNGLDDTITPSRGGPPVGHSIVSSGGSSSGSSSKRSSIASHR